MKIQPLLLLSSFGVLGVFGTVTLAQESEEPSGAGTPVRPFLEPAAPFDPAEDTEFALRGSLTLLDLDVREMAFDAAARRAARDPDVRRALQIISVDTADMDLAFTARLALREADRLAAWGRAGAAFGGQALPSRPNDPFDAMRQRMESLFGSDPFVDDFFGHDPFFSRPFQGHPGVFGVDPFSASDPFVKMRKRMEEMSRSSRLLRDAPGDAPR